MRIPSQATELASFMPTTTARITEAFFATFHQTLYRLCGLKADQVKRLQSLETESRRLRRVISDPTSERRILKAEASRPEGQRQQTPRGRA